ncbi:hypothetical protein GCM10010106_27270 [Thermopolyspora flexuosa]|jgi:hypothetical protein|uniref:Uncharacterized protein n=1 Tax=Thermopolyspora flexuosa TaxID=103836 RepID=A0A543IW96_9ACTN|nr:hypothetical protein [Thermopolyspora flexuosa]TQM74827.1 hypothetical protein FHX40_1511 [Thermopolyspora flexuosa]GGM79243.1 hypothetical protein GCM10010106_27270 [Thermopolyspora flexuosa]
MTENEPISPEDPVKFRLRAGEIGVHRSPVTEPLHHPGYSRNIAPLRFWGFEIAQERYTGRELIPEDDEEETETAPESRTAETRGPAPDEAVPAAPAPTPGTAGEPGKPAEPQAAGHGRRTGPATLLAGLAVLVLVLRRMRRAGRGRHAAGAGR